MELLRAVPRPARDEAQPRQHRRGGRGRGRPLQATYDLHQGDPFWAGHIGAAFQTVASDVDRDLHEYREKMEAINQQGAQVGSQEGVSR